jgi:hypothetical protein
LFGLWRILFNAQMQKLINNCRSPTPRSFYDAV